ncbi:MAG: protease inhibitor I42 family protein [Acidobacteriota bacterium]|nr:protease inhibitor I42 family protein [Acidobacteriota bacterium]
MIILMIAGIIVAMAGGATASVAPVRIAPPDTEVIVTDKDNDKTIAIAQGDILVVRLESQPGTGYAWRIAKYGKANLDFLEETAAAGSAKPGGIEYQIFRFKATKAGSSCVELEYVRAWERDKPALKKFIVHLNILDKPQP